MYSHVKPRPDLASPPMMAATRICWLLVALSTVNGLSVSAPYSSSTSHFAPRRTASPKLSVAGVPKGSHHAGAVFTASRTRAPVLALRGGLAFVPSLVMPTTADGAFQLIFGLLSAVCAAFVFGTREKISADSVKEEVPTEVKSWQRRFLIVFWLFKMADWLQGPYFYEVYASKVIGGVAVSSAGVARLFLTGFGSTALFGAIVGGLVDSLGRKRGSLMFALMYSISALSTRCNALPLLYAGRVAGGIGTSLLFSAPEAWLVSEHQKNKFDGKYLGQTFGLAYFGDAIVAICAGQLAGFAAAARGPAAPFELSVLFLAAGAAVVALLWKENFGGKVQASAEPKPAAIEEAAAEAAVEAAAPEAEASTGGQNSGKLVQEATKAMLEDKKILLVGAVQVSSSSSSSSHRHRHRHRRRRRHRHRHLMRACSLCMCRTHTHARARAPTHTVPLPSSLTPVRAGRPCSPFVASLLHPRRARLCSRAPCTFSCCSGRQPSRPRSAPA
jgi:hypothetical protein